MKLMEDPALVTLVANLVEQAVSETGPDSTFEGMAPVRESSEFARMILDGLEILGVPQRGPVWELPGGVRPAERLSAPALPDGPVVPALRLSYCAMCLQEAANRRGVGLEPLTVHPAVTVIAGNAVCNVDGRHKIVAAEAAVLHQPGHLPPDNPFRRAG